MVAFTRDLSLDIYQQSHLVDLGYQNCNPAATVTASTAPSHGNDLFAICATLGLDPNLPHVRVATARKMQNAALAHSLYQSVCRHDGNNLGEEEALNGCRPRLEVESSFYTGSHSHVVFTSTSDSSYHNHHEQPTIASAHATTPAATCASTQTLHTASLNEQTQIASSNKFDRDYVAIHPEAAPDRGPLKLVAQQQQAQAQAVTNPSAPSILGPLSRYGAKLFHGILKGMRDVGVDFLKLMLTIFLSPTLLTLCQRILECLLLLALLLGTGYLYHGTLAGTILNHSWQVTFAYAQSLGQVLSHATTTGIYELNTQIAINSSIGNRVWQVVVACQELWPLALSILLLGLLSGQHFSLMAEMHHRSLMGLKKFTSLMGWPALILFFLVGLMLSTAFVFCVELSVPSAWVLTFTFGFHTACFYTQHLK